MTYKDNLRASHAQNQVLRQELARKEAEIARLRGDRSTSTEPSKRSEPGRKAVQADTPTRGIRFVAAPTYFPLFTLWRKGLGMTVDGIGSAKLASAPTDKVVVWLARQCARPLLSIARVVLYTLLYAVGLPISVLNLVIHSLVVAPCLLLSSLRFSDRAPARTTSGWTVGIVAKDENLLYFLMTVVIPPLCFPGLWLLIFGLNELVG